MDIPVPSHMNALTQEGHLIPVCLRVILYILYGADLQDRWWMCVPYSRPESGGYGLFSNYRG